MAHWKIESYFVGFEHRRHNGNALHLMKKSASNYCACRRLSTSVLPLSSSGVDSGSGTFGLNRRPAQFAPSSKDPDFSQTRETEEIEWKLSLGTTFEEGEAMPPCPNAQSGGNDANSATGIS